ncbi:hypothetical protein SDC9_157253 [bioreactor metagenome]|uniref:Uncharacterized protein n=1 Tax=bioreactor metagenome TaxID=1076179 RepID=A0A645F7U4_9ZZZZ
MRREVALHPAQTVDDPAVLIQQDEVCPGADQLQHQGAPHPVAQLPGSLQLQAHHPLHRLLGDGQDAPSAQVLAQQHAKHGRSLRVFPRLGGQMQSGPGGIGRQQQTPGLSLGAQGQHHLVPSGLVDFIDSASRYRLLQLADQGGKAYGVQGHGLIPP